MWVFYSLHYIIWRLYDVVGGGKCDFDAVTRADIFLLSSAFADSLTRNMRCAATMSGCTVCFFTGRRGRRPPTMNKVFRSIFWLHAEY